MSDGVIIIKKFLSSEQCNHLNELALKGVQEGWVSLGVSRDPKTQQIHTDYNKRLTSRMHMRKLGVTYPDWVEDIRDSIFKHLRVDKNPIIKGHGSQGIVVSVTYPGGDVYEHKDPRDLTNQMGAYRCNVVTQMCEKGCVLYVDNREIALETGDLHAYWASEYPHYVTMNEGTSPRILWMFGVYRPLEEFA